MQWLLVLGCLLYTSDAADERLSVDLDTIGGQKRFVELNKSAVEGGYEGVMIKDPNAMYECKRTHSWLKAKPFIEVTLKVVSVEEGTGRNKGRLGAILVEGEDDGYEYSLSCGSGFSDIQREESVSYTHLTLPTNA